MSAIRERTVLCVIDLPKKLTSCRNLFAYFSRFGEIKHVSVKKELRSGLIQFSTHFGAQTAKTKGKSYEGEPLNMYWSESTELDPRAKENQECSLPVSDLAWQEDDDKECFGVETVQQSARDEAKKSAKDMIKQHLNLPTIRRRLGTKIINQSESNKAQIAPSPKSPVKVSKVGTKTLLSIKKSLNQVNKRKLVRKEGELLKASSSKLKKSLVHQDKMSKTMNFTSVERTDLKVKLALLDERDKLIRKKTIQDSNIKTAVAIKGTCPDMCPERERILRQVGHAVATYEMLAGSNEMDENRAVKEYIRSSADQEVPLPHDLRSEPVLSMTMNYLITNIINRVDDPGENKAVWYSFCWNRLRSIRKDIILQQLCDLETVKIVEQCARFHISCYDHMWGAEVSGFDDKINTQNLIDCLQTLRHMYEDLSKHSITCPNEAEFYSYLILLKLKSGDVMWEYQQYSLEVQLSPPVQFAIEAYMAFKNNMYSRYFGLVRRASYLTACLMQRYFDEVRTQALKTMSKAYCLPGKNVGLSSSFIVSSLKFDSQKNALRFCEQEEVDVKVDVDEKTHDVYVTTSSYLIREKRLPIAIAVVGENSLFPIYVQHEVHSSFDEFGSLKTSISVSEQEKDVSQSTQDLSYSKENVPEVPIKKSHVQDSHFKFSLSPTKIPENIIQKSLLSSKAEFNNVWADNKSFAINEKSFPDMNKLRSEETAINSKENLERINVDSSIAEPIHEEEMPFEESNLQDNLGIKHDSVFKSQTNSMAAQPISSPFFSSIKKYTLFTPEENKSLILNKSNYFKENNFNETDRVINKAEDKFTFSLGVSKNETSRPNFGNIFTSNESHSIKITDHKVKAVKLHENKADSAKLEGRGHNISGSFNMKIDCKDNLSRVSTTNNKRTSNEDEVESESTKRCLLLEKLLKERAEEERIKMEEIKRIQIEEMKKKEEEQKVLQILKKNLSERLKAISARKYAKQWKEKVDKLKKTRADFPMLLQLTVNSHVSLWGTVNSVPQSSISERAKAKKISVSIMSQLLQTGISGSCKYIGSDLAESLARSAAKSMSKGAIKPVYWKLGISVPWTTKPFSELSVFNQLMRKWCIQSFYKEKNTDLGSVECVTTSLEVPVSISVHFSDDLHSSQGLQAMDALIFIIVNESESEKMCLQRLSSLVTNSVRSEDLCVAVMNIGGSKLERVLRIELEELHEQNLIGHWIVNMWLTSKSVMESICFLTEHVTIAPHICSTPLERLVIQVTEEFFDALSAGQHSSDKLLRAVKNPNSVIYLYNTCLTKLEDLLLSSKLEKYFNFAEEFKMYVPVNESGGAELMCGKQYDDVYKSQISKKINTLKLPEFAKWPPRSSNRLVKMLKIYCAQVHDMSIFPQVIRMLDLPDSTDIVQHLEDVSWLDIVEFWTQCSIRHTFTFQGKNKQMFVIYNKNDVQRMIKKQWWLKLRIVAQV